MPAHQSDLFLLLYQVCQYHIDRTMYDRMKTKSDATVFAVLYTIPFCLHVVGIYLLLRVNRRSFVNATQRVYLINFSAAEILLCKCKVLHRVLFVRNYKEAATYIETVQTSGVFLYCMLIMILLTVDRFLEVYLSLQYYVYWSKHKTKLALIGAIVLSVLLAIFNCILHALGYEISRYIVSMYMWPCTEILFLLTAMITYSYLMRKLYNNRKQIRKLKKDLEKQETNYSVTIRRVQSLRKTKRGVYVPALLIITFVLFWMVPDQIDFYHAITDREIKPFLNVAINVCYVLAIILDAFIYIFTLKSVRKLFCRYLQLLRWKKYTL